jgi:thymidine kinase
MAKLYFRYGTVGSAKTLNLLAVAHNYRRQNKTVSLMKPALDTRFGVDDITSRAGVSAKADVLLSEQSVIDRDALKGMHCVLVDEVQFVAPSVIEQFRAISLDLAIPVICYGLRTDFRSQLFPGSRRLLELADTIEEVKTTCAYCNRKGVFNLKLVGGMPTVGGPTIQLGCEETYLPTCGKCYFSRIEEIE